MASPGRALHKQGLVLEHVRWDHAQRTIASFRTHRSLTHTALAIDTRGYAELPRTPVNLGWTSPSMSFFDVVDSIIEAEAVPAIAALLAGFIPCPLRAWAGEAVRKIENRDIYRDRWIDVFSRPIATADQPPL